MRSLGVRGCVSLRLDALLCDPQVPPYFFFARFDDLRLTCISFSLLLFFYFL